MPACSSMAMRAWSRLSLTVPANGWTESAWGPSASHHTNSDTALTPSVCRRASSAGRSASDTWVTDVPATSWMVPRGAAEAEPEAAAAAGRDKPATDDRATRKQAADRRRQCNRLTIPSAISVGATAGRRVGAGTVRVGDPRVKPPSAELGPVGVQGGDDRVLHPLCVPVAVDAVDDEGETERFGPGEPTDHGRRTGDPSGLRREAAGQVGPPPPVDERARPSGDGQTGGDGGEAGPATEVESRQQLGARGPVLGGEPRPVDHDSPAGGHPEPCGRGQDRSDH